MRLTRDMSEREFNAALERNGFRLQLLWLCDTSNGIRGASYGCILGRDGKLNRRASLAYAIQRREADIARRAELAGFAAKEGASCA